MMAFHLKPPVRHRFFLDKTKIPILYSEQHILKFKLLIRPDKMAFPKGFGVPDCHRIKSIEYRHGVVAFISATKFPLARIPVF